MRRIALLLLLVVNIWAEMVELPQVVEDLARALRINLVVIPPRNAQKESNQTKNFYIDGKYGGNYGGYGEVWTYWNTDASPAVLKRMLQEILKQQGLCVKAINSRNWVAGKCAKGSEKWVWIRVRNPFLVNRQLSDAKIPNYIVGKGIYVPAKYAKLVKRADFRFKKYRVTIAIGEVDIDYLKSLGVALGSSGVKISPTGVAITGTPNLKQLLIGIFEDKTHTTLISMPTLYLTEMGESVWEDGGEVRYVDTNVTLIGEGNVVERSQVKYAKQKIGFSLVLKGGIESNNTLPIAISLEDIKVASLAPLQLVTRKISNTIFLKPNEPVLLVGLGRTIKTIKNTGIPYLSKLPVLGWLFRSKVVQTTRRALVVAIWLRRI
jgi:hypothetical protein